ncbi:MAG TPA: DsbA family oxidoreductase [Gaiellaceae bacterium]|nr:DsbA family oxidoreductase [Gaiellaceae bacterium]
MTWLPFDLHPEYPPDGIPRTQLHARYGDTFHGRLRARFAEEGLDYNPPPEVVPNTLRALRVTELTRERGLHAAVHDRLMDAYWAEARNIGDPDVLRELAVEAGLDGPGVDEVLAGDAYRDRVHGLTAQAVSIGVTGVPGFLLDRRLLVLGAQPQEVFERRFAQLSEIPPDP